MTIYLYVKTHNKTGLKYLGKTGNSDPHKYPGSGVRWKRHLNKHGYDYTTDILKECQSEEELIEWGLYYSNLWNIVESNDWANLKEEAGPHGKMRPRTVEHQNKLIAARKGKPSPLKGRTLPPQSEESNKKRSISLKGIKKSPQSEESIEKRRKSLMGNIPWNKGKKTGPQTEEHKAKRFAFRKDKC